jgi:polyisoprenoid-binding protein YceI
MKKILLRTVWTLFLLNSFITYSQVDFKADTEASVLNWKGFKPTGEHYGTVAVKNGFFTVKDKQILSGEFEIDMTSIVNLDIDADSEYNAKLVIHLKNEDFFNVEKYPEASFKIVETENKGNKTIITGDLTIKGITHSIAVPASVKSDGENLYVKSEKFKIDRSKWDIKYKSKSFFSDLGDNFIDNDIELSFVVTAKK